MLFVVDLVCSLNSPISLMQFTVANCACSRLLVRHPESMQRLREEVTSVMGDSVHPTREQIRKMPYLANVIKECTFICSYAFSFSSMLSE